MEIILRRAEPIFCVCVCEFDPLNDDFGISFKDIHFEFGWR